MDHFTAHRLRVVVEARGHVELNEHQGSAIRGALFHALRNRFCGNREAGDCAACPLVTTCPVATLVSTLDPEGQRGRDVPRPFTIQPPIANSESQIANHKSPITMGHFAERDDGSVVVWYAPGEQFEFGLTLFAQAMQLFPYVVLALSEVERGGIGRRTQQPDGNWRRGLLAVREVWAENPLTGERKPVLRSGDRMVQVPDIPITHKQVTHHASCLTHHASCLTPHVSRLTLHFLTPTRLVEGGRLLKPDTFQFQPLFRRLIERLEALSAQFCDTPLRYEQTRPLIEAAAHVRTVENRLRWEEVRSYSTRRHAESPTSGLLGRVTLQADDWSPFLPWLLWGQFTHVGKDAVKGNGWYEVGRGDGAR